MIVFKSYPFHEAIKTDRYYKYIYKNTEESFEQYWLAMEGRMKKKGVDINKISSSFKRLIFKMLCYDFN